MNTKYLHLLYPLFAAVLAANSLHATSSVADASPEGSTFSKFNAHLKKNSHKYAMGIGAVGLLNLAYLFKSKAKLRRLFDRGNRRGTTQLILGTILPFLLAGGIEWSGYGATDKPVHSEGALPVAIATEIDGPASTQSSNIAENGTEVMQRAVGNEASMLPSDCFTSLSRVGTPPPTECHEGTLQVKSPSAVMSPTIGERMDYLDAVSSTLATLTDFSDVVQKAHYLIDTLKVMGMHDMSDEELAASAEAEKFMDLLFRVTRKWLALKEGKEGGATLQEKIDYLIKLGRELKNEFEGIDSNQDDAGASLWLTARQCVIGGQIFAYFESYIKGLEGINEAEANMLCNSLNEYAGFCKNESCDQESAERAEENEQISLWIIQVQEKIKSFSQPTATIQPSMFTRVFNKIKAQFLSLYPSRKSYK
ncbi:MAG: hypothetical protein QG632_379 [Candidatus Dependentiae bacterium]|nr:hypothetical protein [Candidatus Dependentiae bacterium]